MEVFRLIILTDRGNHFFSSTNAAGVDDRISPRYMAFANASIKMSDMVIINPMAYFTTQAKSSELVGGANLQYNLSGDGETLLTGRLVFPSG